MASSRESQSRRADILLLTTHMPTPRINPPLFVLAPALLILLVVGAVFAYAANTYDGRVAGVTLSMTNRAEAFRWVCLAVAGGAWVAGWLMVDKSEPKQRANAVFIAAFALASTLAIVGLRAAPWGDPMQVPALVGIVSLFASAILAAAAVAARAWLAFATILLGALIPVVAAFAAWAGVVSSV